MNNRIEVRKGELISKEYINHKKQEAIALLKFRFPECDIEIKEDERNIVILAVAKNKDDRGNKMNEGDER